MQDLSDALIVIVVTKLVYDIYRKTLSHIEK